MYLNNMRAAARVYLGACCIALPALLGGGVQAATTPSADPADVLGLQISSAVSQALAGKQCSTCPDAPQDCTAAIQSAIEATIVNSGASPSVVQGALVRSKGVVPKDMCLASGVNGAYASVALAIADVNNATGAGARPGQGNFALTAPPVSSGGGGYAP